MLDWIKLPFQPHPSHAYKLYALGEQLLMMPVLRGDETPLIGWYSGNAREFAPVPIDMSALEIVGRPVIHEFQGGSELRPVMPDGRFFVTPEIHCRPYYLAEAWLSPERVVFKPSVLEPPERDHVTLRVVSKSIDGRYWAGTDIDGVSEGGRMYCSTDLVTWTQVGGDLPGGVHWFHHRGERMFATAYNRLVEVVGGELVERGRFKDWIRSIHVADSGTYHAFMECFVGLVPAGLKRPRQVPIPFSAAAAGRPSVVAIDGGFVMAHGGLWFSRDGLAFEQVPGFPGRAPLRQLHAVRGGAIVLTDAGELYFVRA